MSMDPQELVDKLKAANAAYYAGSPIMTDDEYDVLRELLEANQPNHPFLSQVGAASTGGIWQKRKHEIPMGSLNKVKGLTGLRTWWERAVAEIGA